MKCEKCGHNEASVHYTSNINGAVTEANLCQACAKEQGITYGSVFGGTPAGMFGNMLNGFSMPSFDMMRSGYGLIFPAMMMQIPGAAGMYGQPMQGVAPSGRAASISADDSIKRRREINMLREEMNKAAAAEDFEKAAEIRDRIKVMEQGESAQRSATETEQ